VFSFLLFSSVYMLTWVVRDSSSLAFVYDADWHENKGSWDGDKSVDHTFRVIEHRDVRISNSLSRFRNGAFYSIMRLDMIQKNLSRSLAELVANTIAFSLPLPGCIWWQKNVIASSAKSPKDMLLFTCKPNRKITDFDLLRVLIPVKNTKFPILVRLFCI